MAQRIITYSVPSPMALVTGRGERITKLSMFLNNDILMMMTGIFGRGRSVILFDADALHVVDYSIDDDMVVMPAGYVEQKDPANIVDHYLTTQAVVLNNEAEIVRHIIPARYDTVCVSGDSVDPDDCEVYQDSGDPEYEPAVPLPPSSLVVMAYTTGDLAKTIALMNIPVRPIEVIIATDDHGSIEAISIAHETVKISAALHSDAESLFVSMDSGYTFMVGKGEPGDAVTDLVENLKSILGSDAVFLGALVLNRRNMAKSTAASLRSMIDSCGCGAHIETEPPLHMHI